MFRAKMKVISINRTKYSDVIKLNCEYSNTPEDNSFSKATPAGNCELTISNPDLIGKVEPDQCFYLDFTPVPEGAAK